MKKLIILCLGLSVISCDLRLRNGEDISSLTKQEKNSIINNIEYMRDPETKLCFAVINNQTDGFRNTFSITVVPCEKLKNKGL